MSAAQNDLKHALPAVLQVVKEKLLWQRTLNTWLTIPAVTAANNIVAVGQAGGDAAVAVAAPPAQMSAAQNDSKTCITGGVAGS